jgi:hypothetical protein
MPDAAPAELKAAIAEGRTLIICGAGVSRAATNGAAPGWAQLIKDALGVAKVEQPGDAGWVKACEALLSPDERASEWLLAADIIQGKLGPVFS